MEGIQIWRVSHAPSLTMKSLKPNPVKKTSPFMMVMACSCSSKPLVKTLALPLSTTGKQQPHKFESRLIPCPYTRSSTSDTRPALNHACARHGSQQKQEQASEQRQIELDSIFSTVAANWFQIKSRSVTEDYAKDIWRSLDKDVFPAIGAIPVQEIKARTIVEALEPIKARGALETVRRLVQRINEIMIYAVNTGLIDANPASGVGMAFEKPKKQNMPTLRPEELPKLMRSLVMSNLSVTTRCLIEWQLLTLVRPSEASGARWVEIDLNAKLWTIPAERMKAKREHIVPLSPQALEILEVMKPISAHREHIFPSRNNPKQAMNSQTANAALKRIGYGGKLVAHGLRSIASTAMNEAGFNADVIEAALAHSDKNEVRKAYNRSTYLLQRKELMEWWGTEIHK